MTASESVPLASVVPEYEMYLTSIRLYVRNLINFYTFQVTPNIVQILDIVLAV
jgi:hypothetical protein